MPRGKAIPAGLKILQGRGPGRDSGGRPVHALPFRRLAPAKPADLSAEASEHWDEIVPELSRLQLLKTSDVGGLTMLCEIWSRWQRARRLINSGGPGGEILSAGKDMPHRNPAIAVAESAEKAYRLLAAEFGLNPANEGRVHAKKEEDDDGPNPFA